MKKYFLTLAFIFLSFHGCIPKNEVEMNIRDYIIENDTDYKVDIKFYLNGNLNNLTSKVLNSKGEQLSEKVEQTSEFDNSGNNLLSAYQGNSIKIIFNNTKFYTHTFNTFNETFSEPIDRNLFWHSNYENLGNEKYLFKITEQDYENAEDCNGNCD